MAVLASSLSLAISDFTIASSICCSVKTLERPSKPKAARFSLFTPFLYAALSSSGPLRSCLVLGKPALTKALLKV